MMRKSLKRVSITIAILLVVSAGALFLNLHQNKNKTAHVKRGSIVEGVYGIGTVKANKSYQLRSGILTTITRVYIREGDSINAKEPLIDLDILKSINKDLKTTVIMFTHDLDYAQQANRRIELKDGMLVTLMRT